MKNSLPESNIADLLDKLKNFEQQKLKLDAGEKYKHEHTVHLNELIDALFRVEKKACMRQSQQYYFQEKTNHKIGFELDSLK